MDIKNRLKEERNERDLTQKQIADMLKITRTAYTAYETGQNIPPIEILVKLADFYKISLDELIGRIKKLEE